MLQGDGPMEEWTPEEIADHVAYMLHVAPTLEARSQHFGRQALSPEGAFVRYGKGSPAT